MGSKKYEVSKVNGNEEPGKSYSQDSVLKKLPLRLKLGYGAGHVLNDMCSAIWFSYLIIYFSSVLNFNKVEAGALLFFGQIVDALATPFVGIQVDQPSSTLFKKYGWKKFWHFLGTILVLCSFPFLINRCLGCTNSDAWAQLIYFSGFALIFQIGWAFVQVSHVSLMTDLTPCSTQRIVLNSYRYAATVISNIAVFGIAWVFLKTNDETENRLGPQDSGSFQKLIATVLTVGSLFSIIFHVLVKETSSPVGFTTDTIKYVTQSSINTDKDVFSESQTNSSSALDGIKRESKAFKPKAFKWWKWLKVQNFYQVAITYAVTRFVVNIQQLYMVLYLQETLLVSKENLAIVPLVNNVTGLLVALLMKPLSKKLGTRVVFIIGSLLSVMASVWVWFGEGESYKMWQIYVVSIIYGSGGSTMLVMSLALTADLVGENKRSGGFVFGAMSFVDKVVNGAAVVIIQEIKSKSPGVVGSDVFYRNVLVFGCGLAALLVTALEIYYATRYHLKQKKSVDQKESRLESY